MKLKLHENSLFAILGRSPWWASALLAAGAFGAMRFFLPIEMAVFGTTPFALIALWVLWKELRAPSAAKTAAALERLAALPREDFTAALEAGWRREGYEVSRPRGAPIDFELRREGKLSVVSCRRWKAERTGIEPLRELHAAGRARDAHELIYVAGGALSEQAGAFAAQNRVKVIGGADLARLARG